MTNKKDKLNDATAKKYFSDFMDKIKKSDSELAKTLTLTEVECMWVAWRTSWFIGRDNLRQGLLGTRKGDA